MSGVHIILFPFLYIYDKNPNFLVRRVVFLGAVLAVD